MQYSNRYGAAEISLIGEVVHVSEINGAAVVNAGYGFDIDTAEKLALITENRHLQPAYNRATKSFYVMYHHTSIMVQVCRLDGLTYTGGDPRLTIEQLNRCQYSL